MSIKFPLEMGEGVQVRNLSDLKENFDVERVVAYYLDGKLKKWLDARWYEEESEKVSGLDANNPFLAQCLCEIFGVEYKLEKIEPEKIAIRNTRISKLKQYTDDQEIIKNVDSVAFNQEELADLYEKDIEKIYLCEGVFKIPKSKKHKNHQIIGRCVVEGLNIKSSEISTESFTESYNYLKEASEKAVVKFGKFEWIILKKTEEKILLLSRNILFEKKINERRGAEWEDCDLRKWLNEEFILEFTSQERSMIESTVNENVTKMEIFWTYDYEKEKCNNNKTVDNIFLLSSDEVLTYFKYHYKPYPFDDLIEIEDDIKAVWLTRTPMKLYPNKGIYLYKSIADRTLRFSSIDGAVGIRPAMWVCI